MPKKFSSENTKAVAAKARKAAARELEEDKRKQAVDDALWKDDDKNQQRKQQRKDGKEKKKQEILDKKANTKTILEQELKEIGVSVIPKQPAAKITRAQIQEEHNKRQAAAKSSSTTHTKPRVELPQPLEENINRHLSDEAQARSITEAIHVLSMDPTVYDRHPEKRTKAAFAAFQDKVYPTVKSENPTFRYSQLQQKIRDMWAVSSDNPGNLSFYTK